MDILRKFRYNFHYWLRNCYQLEDMKELTELQPYQAQTKNQPQKYQNSPYTNNPPPGKTFQKNSIKGFGSDTQTFSSSTKSTYGSGI